MQGQRARRTCTRDMLVETPVETDLSGHNIVACRANDKLHCLSDLVDSTSPNARSSSTTAVTEIAAVFRTAPQHDSQVTRSRRAGLGVADSAGDDYRRVE